MKKLLIAALLCWTGTSFAQSNVQNLQVKLTPVRLQFVPPEELAKKPNHPAASAAAAYTATVTVEGVNAQKQAWTWTGPIRSYAAHAIVSPRDPASGLATGKRMHKPFTILMEKDAPSPLVAHLKANEVITSVTLNFTPVANGGATHAFRMREISIPKLVQNGEWQELAFTFQKITWTWVDAGKTATDDWETPVI